MIIALHDADNEYLKHKTFPNYALMKISAFHKEIRHNVEWWNPLDTYDCIYSSKIFTFTPDNMYLPENTIKGGTGYDIRSKLPEKIDSMFPDYSIYPKCDYAIGFITRGCPRKCEWCVVPEKEGTIQEYRSWKDLVRKDSDKLVLMDNNILSSKFGLAQLESLTESNIKIDLNQGMDARLVTDEIAHLLSKLKWISFIRFSCDQISQIESVVKASNLLSKYGIKPYKIFVYLLVRKDLKDADERVQELKKLKNISIYAQAERDFKNNIMPNKLQLEFAQRYIYGKSYKKENWTDYCKRNNLKSY